MRTVTALSSSIPLSVLLIAFGCAESRSASADPVSSSAAHAAAPGAVSSASSPSASSMTSASGAPSAATQAASASFDRPGYTTILENGRLWVFRTGSKELAKFHKEGEPAKSVTRPGGGPNRMTIKAVDAATLDGYMMSNGGYAAFIDDGRLWVFRAGSKDLSQFLQHGEPAKSVTRPGGGPDRMTIRAVDAATIDGYMHCRPGFVTFMDNGRLWIFRDGSEDLAKFIQHGEPAKSVTRPGAGPNRMTVRAVDGDTIDGYMAIRVG